MPGSRPAPCWCTATNGVRWATSPKNWREGATLAYEQLSDVSTRMDVEYGIRIDVFADPPKRLFVWWKERGLEDKVCLKHYLNY